jgi:hypothetical protein
MAMTEEERKKLKEHCEKRTDEVIIPAFEKAAREAERGGTTLEKLEKIQEECSSSISKRLDSITDEQFNAAIQKGVDEALAEIDPEDVYQGQWIDQQGRPCDPPDWIEEVDGVKRIKKHK